jgi:uncharacterized repeat protein (TIGR03803 family)
MSLARTVASVLCCSLLASCARPADAPPIPAGAFTGAATARAEPLRDRNSQPLGTVFAVSTAGEERVLYRFSNTLGDRGDGASPYAGLTEYNGALYGTTLLGIVLKRDFNGSAFEVTTDGGEHVLHIFGHGADGVYPYGGLTAFNGMLYGTTSQGGVNNAGTVFELNPKTGNFKSGSDGTNPTGNLIVLHGALYGTTSGGRGGGADGASGPGCGTVFKISPSGKERILYSFKCRSDGAFPHAGVIALNGKLYGTTTQGGESGSGAGTIFQLSMSGTERVIHIFTGYPSDGAYAFGGLIARNGVLYGTTVGGGSSSACIAPLGGYGCGTVYEVTTSGSVRVIYSFGGGTDGEFPYGGLVNKSGGFYGTTGFGGGTACSYYGTGCGTIFEVTASGVERVLYRFQGGTDGANPYAGLTAVHETLYGTTYFGGAGRGR